MSCAIVLRPHRGARLGRSKGRIIGGGVRVCLHPLSRRPSTMPAGTRHQGASRCRLASAEERVMLQLLLRCLVGARLSISIWTMQSSKDVVPPNHSAPDACLITFMPKKCMLQAKNFATALENLSQDCISWCIFGQ